MSLILLGLTPHAWPATLVGQWTFEEGCGPAIDGSGQGNHGTIVGCTYIQMGVDEFNDPTLPAAIGQFALQYDADGDLVSVPTAGWSANAGTIALWVNLSSFPAGDHFFVGHTTTPPFANRIQLYTNGNDGLLDIGIGNSHAVAANVAPIPLNIWTHLALSWNNGTYTVYVGGAPVHSGSYTGLTAIAPTAHLGNSGDAANAIGGMRGAIDAVHVYDGALSLQEIQALAGVTGGGGPSTFEGFAAAATGGQPYIDTQACEGEFCEVTNCFADNPPATPRRGSFRWATGGTGNKYIKVNVACPTPVNFGPDFVYVRSNTTIDAMNAPSPGFQYIGSITVDGSRCSPRCNNIVIKGLIYRGDGTTASCSGVAFNIERGGNLVVIDRVTIYKSSNDSISITANEGSPVTYTDTRDITLSRLAIISPTRPGNPSVEGSGCPSDIQSEYGAKTAMVMDNKVRRITIKDSFFKDVKRRIPWLAYHDADASTDTMLDMRNNVLFDIGGESSRDGGAFFRDHAQANFVNNYVSMYAGLSTDAMRRYLMTCKSSGTQVEDLAGCSGESAVDAVYAAGTVHAQNQANDPGKRTTSTELSAGFTNTVDACTAAQNILATAGAPQRNAADQSAFSSVTLTGCAVTPQAPTINVFNANPASITAGNSTTLHWDASNATTCSIDQGVGQVCAGAVCETGGQTVRSPTVTTTYTMTCTNAGGSRTAQAPVTVNPVGPNINVFKADPLTIQQGNSSILTCDATNATGGCTIDQNVGSCCANATACETGGTKSVTPSTTTTYTLTCTNVSGSPTATATVMVTPTPPVSARRLPWIGG